jgi:hypothetical protein
LSQPTVRFPTDPVNLSLDDALRGINAAGGSIAVRGPLRQALEAGDRATGTRVLRELYGRMGEAPMRVDLDGW